MITTTQEEAHRIFEATMNNAKSLINKGVPAASIIAGLLGVVAGIGCDAAGPEETARALRLAAASLEEDGLDS